MIQWCKTQKIPPSCGVGPVHSRSFETWGRDDYGYFGIGGVEVDVTYIVLIEVLYG